MSSKNNGKVNKGAKSKAGKPDPVAQQMATEDAALKTAAEKALVEQQSVQAPAPQPAPVAQEQPKPEQTVTEGALKFAVCDGPTGKVMGFIESKTHIGAFLVAKKAFHKSGIRVRLAAQDPEGMTRERAEMDDYLAQPLVETTQMPPRAKTPEQLKKETDKAKATPDAPPAKATPAKATPAKPTATQPKQATTPKEPAAPKQPSKPKQAAEPRIGDNLNGSEERILTVLAGSKTPLTRKEMAEKTGIQKGWSRLLGAATKEGGGAAGKEGLEARGLVRCVKAGSTESTQGEGAKSLQYEITPAGREALEKAAAKPKEQAPAQTTEPAKAEAKK